MIATIERPPTDSVDDLPVSMDEAIDTSHGSYERVATAEDLVRDLLHHPDKYAPELRPHIVNVAIRNDHEGQREHPAVQLVTRNLGQLSAMGALNASTAQELINGNFPRLFDLTGKDSSVSPESVVHQNLDKFPGFGSREQLKEIIRNGRGDWVTNNLERLGLSLDADLVETYVASGQCDFGILEQVRKGHVPGVQYDATFVNKIIDHGPGMVAMDCVTHEAPGFVMGQDVALRLARNGFGQSLMNAAILQPLKGVEYTPELAQSVADGPHGLAALREGFSLFRTMPQEVGRKLLQSEDASDRTLAIEHIDKFPGLVLDDALAKEMANAGALITVLEKFEAFTSIDSVLAQAAAEYPSFLAQRLHLFPRISAEAITILSHNVGYQAEAISSARDTHPAERASWYARQAHTYNDGPWPLAKVGQVIESRLKYPETGDLHAASAWLGTFAIPEGTYDVDYIKAHRLDEHFDPSALAPELLRDPVLEGKLLRAILESSPELRQQLKLSAKPEALIQLLSNPANQLLYYALVSDHEGDKLYKHPSLNEQLLRQVAITKRHEFWQAYNGSVALGKQANVLGNFRLREEEIVLPDTLPSITADEMKVSSLVMQLKKIGAARKQYAEDAANWLLRHKDVPTAALKKVWPDRALALMYGVEATDGKRIATVNDSVAGIHAWQKHTAFKLFVHTMEDTNVLADMGISGEELLGPKWSAARTELARVLSTKDTFEAITKLRQWQAERPAGWRRILPAASVKITSADLLPATGSEHTKPDSWEFAILNPDDAAGFTIGEDTGCCMTIHGVSKSCIEAGYTRENTGFLAIRSSEGRVVAQSFWYINPEHPDTLVIDNIEANKGKDMNRVISLYQEGLRRMFENIHNGDERAKAIRHVNLGEGYTSVDFATLSSVVPTPPLTGIYSDAKVGQRRLLDITASPNASGYGSRAARP